MYIYLDQNKWIDLGRADLGREDGSDYIAVCKRIQTKVDNGDWILPISIVHMMETLDIVDTDRRKRFSHILLKFSKMNSMCSYFKIEKYEFLNAMLKILNKGEINIKDYLFSRNIYHLFDLSLSDINVVAEKEEIKNRVEEILRDIKNSPQALYYLINSNFFKTSTEANKKEWISAAAEQEKIRMQLFADIKDDAAIFHHIIAGGYIHRRDKYFDFVSKKLIDMGTSTNDIDRMVNYVQEHFDDFLKTMPTLYVAAKLTFQRFKNSSKPFHRNDIKDIAFLSAALPYCEVVVTEKSWLDFIKREELDNLFKTKIFSDLNDLMLI
jgi:uncharacterized membrane protein